jgi:hypothetical protein
MVIKNVKTSKNDMVLSTVAGMFIIRNRITGRSVVMTCTQKEAESIFQGLIKRLN